VKQISEEVLYARRAGASHTVSGELANLDNLKECNCSALAQRVGELEDWKKITDTAGKKLAEDNIRLRKALENVRKAQGDCMCHHVQGKCIKCIADEALKEV